MSHQRLPPTQWFQCCPKLVLTSTPGNQRTWKPTQNTIMMCINSFNTDGLQGTESPRLCVVSRIPTHKQMCKWVISCMPGMVGIMMNARRITSIAKVLGMVHENATCRDRKEEIGMRVGASANLYQHQLRPYPNVLHDNHE